MTLFFTFVHRFCKRSKGVENQGSQEEPGRAAGCHSKLAWTDLEILGKGMLLFGGETGSLCLSWDYFHHYQELGLWVPDLLCCVLTNFPSCAFFTIRPESFARFCKALNLGFSGSRREKMHHLRRSSDLIWRSLQGFSHRLARYPNPWATWKNISSEIWNLLHMFWWGH